MERDYLKGAQVDCIVVRTRLQCLIALNLIKTGVIKQPPVAIFLYKDSKNEDSQAVRNHYDRLKARSKWSIDLVQNSLGAGASTLLFAFIAIAVGVSRGRMYIASIDYYPAAVAARLFPMISIATFDDGTANVVRTSKYFSAVGLNADASFIRRVIDRLLPMGASWFLRSKTETHYSLYPGLRNIIDTKRVVPVEVDWLSLAGVDDHKYSCCTTILLGAVYQETPEGLDRLRIASEVVGGVDLYMPHPRAGHDICAKRKYEGDAPAETIIAIMSQGKPITVYHFGSSAILPFLESTKVKSVRLGE